MSDESNGQRTVQKWFGSISNAARPDTGQTLWYDQVAVRGLSRWRGWNSSGHSGTVPTGHAEVRGYTTSSHCISTTARFAFSDNSSYISDDYRYMHIHSHKTGIDVIIMATVIVAVINRNHRFVVPSGDLRMFMSDRENAGLIARSIPFNFASDSVVDIKEAQFHRRTTREVDCNLGGVSS